MFMIQTPQELPPPTWTDDAGLFLLSPDQHDWQCNWRQFNIFPIPKLLRAILISKHTMLIVTPQIISSLTLRSHSSLSSHHRYQTNFITHGAAPSQSSLCVSVNVEPLLTSQLPRLVFHLFVLFSVSIHFLSTSVKECPASSVVFYLLWLAWSFLYRSDIEEHRVCCAITCMVGLWPGTNGVSHVIH